MKRREFLAASASVATVAIAGTRGALAASPCPPPALQVRGGQSVSSACVGPGSAPQWFVDQASGSWLPIAGPGTVVGAGGTLDAVKPSQAAFDAMAASAGGTTVSAHASLTTAWTGACVDQARKEYLMVANGGHADYCGNEAYALKLNQAQPKWVRLNDPTTSISVNSMADYFTPATYADGRSRAMHTAGYANCIDGKVWFAMQNSYTSSAGTTSLSIVSFNRNQYPDAATGQAPTAYAGDPNPWITNYGTLGGISTGGTDGLHFGLTAYDSLTKDVWTTANSSTSNGYFRLRTTPFSTTTFRNAVAWSGAPYAFMACASDLRLLIVGIWAQNVIFVKPLDNDGAGFTPVKLPDDGFNWDPSAKWVWPGYGPNTPPGVNRMYDKMSANYHAPSKSIWVVSPYSIGSTVRRLSIPISGSAYDPAGTWAWSTLTPATPPGMVGVVQGTFNKCRMIDDMGNGQAAMVYCESTTGPTYVYKLPV